MNRKPIQSSSIASVGYEPDTQTLELEFQGRRVYQYFDVPEFVHQGLTTAASPGTYFSEHIRGRYRYART